MTNEFHTLNGTCSSLVPSGAGYSNVSLENQACSTVGAVPGVATVDGNNFLRLSFSYNFGNLWRNFGLVIAFGLFFIAVLLAFTEWNTASALSVGSVLYVRGKKGAAEELEKEQAAANLPDLEKPPALGSLISRTSTAQDRASQERALQDLKATPDIFSWQNLVYTVPIGRGETRKLLDEVSGYVTPGKLTALMGESGAGKVSSEIFGFQSLSFHAAAVPYLLPARRGRHKPLTHPLLLHCLPLSKAMPHFYLIKGS